jgi:hypothetical protein
MAPVSRTAHAPVTQERLLRRGLRLEYATLAWNVVGSVVLLVAAAAVGSLALAGFGVDSVIEIVASAVVVWADPLAALVVLAYSVREARHAWGEAQKHVSAGR